MGKVLAILGTLSTMHLLNCFIIKSLGLYCYCFSRVKRLTHVLKSVEEDALNKVVPLKNNCRHELFYDKFFLELCFSKPNVAHANSRHEKGFFRFFSLINFEYTILLILVYTHHPCGTLPTPLSLHVA